MLNVLQTKIAFADWVKKNILSKSATRIVWKGDKEICLRLEVTDLVDLKGKHFGCWTWSINIINKCCVGIYKRINITTHFTNGACGAYQH